MTDTTSQDDGEESDLKSAREISSFGFPLMGEKSCDQLLVTEEGDLPPYLRCSKVEMSLLMTLFLVKGSKEMIIWTLASFRLATIDCTNAVVGGSRTKSS